VGGQLVGELDPQHLGIVEREYQKEINEAEMNVDSDEDLRGDYEFDLMKDEGRF